jgi:hypothetical protein
MLQAYWVVRCQTCHFIKHVVGYGHVGGRDLLCPPASLSSRRSGVEIERRHHHDSGVGSDCAWSLDAGVIYVGDVRHGMLICQLSACI